MLNMLNMDNAKSLALLENTGSVNELEMFSQYHCLVCMLC